jgi:valyl-tRNA synthetase
MVLVFVDHCYLPFFTGTVFRNLSVSSVGSINIVTLPFQDSKNNRDELKVLLEQAQEIVPKVRGTQAGSAIQSHPLPTLDLVKSATLL